MMSSASSMPQEKRMRSGGMPAALSCSSVIWRWVWLAGSLVLLSAVHQSQLNQALEGIKNHLVAEGLPRLWCPREIIPVEAIPALPTGKMDLKGCQILAYEALNIPH